MSASSVAARAIEVTATLPRSPVVRTIPPAAITRQSAAGAGIWPAGPGVLSAVAAATKRLAITAPFQGEQATKQLETSVSLPAILPGPITLAVLFGLTLTWDLLRTRQKCRSRQSKMMSLRFEQMAGP